MVHKIFGWIGGYLKVYIQGRNVERFVNLCRNHHIVLWQLYWNEKKDKLFFRIYLRDFYRLRPIARKCKVHPVVVKRIGFPFLIGHMKKRASFCLGGVGFCMLVLFLSTRIWGISLEGQSYHTRESILRYLDTINVYGGVAGSSIECGKLEEKIRRQYRDIGWVSVEKKASRLYIRIKEVRLVQKEHKKKKGHLIAQKDGTVVSIVTRKGTAHVKAGDSVKAGDILISGVVKIYGDDQSLMEKEYVHAEGTVVLEETEDYQDVLHKQYQKKVYTAREKRIQEWQIGSSKFFCYNPLKKLETFEKYDIIREGGQLCPFISVRFPIRHYEKRFREITYKKAVYSQKEADEILQKRLEYYLLKKKKKGYVLKKQNVRPQHNKKQYQFLGKLTFWKEQTKYRGISKSKMKYKEKETNGNNGNGNRNTDGT